MRPELAPLLAKVLDRLFLCASRHMPTFTDFYDPVKWTYFEEEVKKQKQDVNIAAFGGSENCERRMLGFFPLDLEENESVFPIVRLRIEHNNKFNKMPRHQDYLGSIIGLGFDRGRIGDIFVSPEKEYGEVFVHKDISAYICEQLEKVGRVPVKAREVSADEAGLIMPKEAEGQLNVASLRLDAVVAALFRLSRGQAAALIGAEKVFVNWLVLTDSGRQVKPGDMVTVRGHGRARIGEVLGATKKERLRVQIFRSM